MYDVSSKFNTFYASYVVLPKDDQNKLHHVKELNIQRLKDGLTEYNTEYGTSYDIIETCVQGSVAMSTVVQNEDSDYDIDVAIVFNKSSLGDKGPLATRNIVADALRRKTKQFNADPEVKTSCVRVKYADGYHIDFAIYRKSMVTGECIYEHAGSEWNERELKGLTNWFKTQNDASNGNLRKIVRLSKMFCKSRENWINMPSGLLQTVLCDEKLQDYDRTDELFYYTMKEIVDRLESNTSVSAPVDNGRNLTPRQSDIQKMINWKNRLKSKLEDLDVLFSNECTQNDAVQAWYGFFKHDFWNDQAETETNTSALVQKAVHSFTETEEFIDDLFPVKIHYQLRVSCKISGNGIRQMPINKYINSIFKAFGGYIPHNFKIECWMDWTDTPGKYDVYWKVKNVGPEAERRNMIRGQILSRGNYIQESTSFFGNHYIECYIVKDNICVAKYRTKIPISR